MIRRMTLAIFLVISDTKLGININLEPGAVSHYLLKLCY